MESSSLSPDDIPHKLRCANCSKLAINAFRLPCCEQAICESCTTLLSSWLKSLRETCTNIAAGHENLPSSCPVCEHSPLSAEDCAPNKTLRTTIKVFLRTAEKKRSDLKLKEAKEAALPPPEPAQEQAQPDAEPMDTANDGDDRSQTIAATDTQEPTQHDSNGAENQVCRLAEVCEIPTNHGTGGRQCAKSR